MALLRRLLEVRVDVGIVLSIVHLHHGLRGREADEDAEFVAGLAKSYDLPFEFHRLDTPAKASFDGKGVEDAARSLRYGFFGQILREGRASAVVTAHTLDDQAETVLLKLLRGAWTEGLAGIQPVFKLEGGEILRPFLQATRAGIERWLKQLHQPWREDSTNDDPAYTRNRVRHELLPLLSEFNPEIARQLSRLAAISSGEEDYWQRELNRVLPSILLSGRPVRGGGRSHSAGAGDAMVAIDLDHLRRLHPAVQRRVLRAAARQMGARLNFDHTEALMELHRASGRPGGHRQVQLPGQVLAERTPRELRFLRRQPGLGKQAPEYGFSIPGEVVGPAFGLSLRARLSKIAGDPAAGENPAAILPAVLRNWRPGDRAILRYSQGPKKVKEILSRLQATGTDRELWPVVECAGKIVWMRGAEVQAPEFEFTFQPLPHELSAGEPVQRP